VGRSVCTPRVQTEKFGLQLANTLYRHLDNLRLLYAPVADTNLVRHTVTVTLAVTLVDAVIGDQSAEVGERVVNAVTTSLFNYTM